MQRSRRLAENPANPVYDSGSALAISYGKLAEEADGARIYRVDT
jgi:hypothetical protein